MNNGKPSPQGGISLPVASAIGPMEMYRKPQEFTRLLPTHKP